jgi:uncharacterized membrane protein
MSPAHLHLMLNHVPVLGVIFGLGLLIQGLRRRSEELKRAALGVFVIVGLLAIPVYLSGESAADAVKSLPGVTGPIVERHDNAAAAAFTGMLALGGMALAGLLRFRGARVAPGWFIPSILAVSLLVSALMGWTAYLGGQIRHTEIRAHATPVAP